MTLSLTTTIHNLIFHKDEIYCIDSKKEINALDVPQYPSNNDISMARRKVVPARDGYIQPVHGIGTCNLVIYYYLVESCTGELLVVTRYDYGYKIVTCTVYRVGRGG